MKIYALNASPRKGWSSDEMLNAFINGVREAAPEKDPGEIFYLPGSDYSIYPTTSNQIQPPPKNAKALGIPRVLMVERTRLELVTS